MIDFSQARNITIPEGVVAKITDGDGNVLWDKSRFAPDTFRYVSLGDSIAAGYAINSDWYKTKTSLEYGEGESGGNKQTAIITGTYTELLHRHYSADNTVRTMSFAHSGDTVADLMTKLANTDIRAEVSKADLITVSIGANDVYQTVLRNLEEYIMSGDLAEIESTIEQNLATLESSAFTALLDELTRINNHAEIVFTTVYNPYKYLWIEGGHYGFFKPILNLIPEMVIDVDKIIEDMFLGGTDLSYFDLRQWKWVSIELEANISSLIKDGLLNTPIVQLLFNRVNGLGDWAEGYITRLNSIIKAKINTHSNANISFVDTKAVYDTYPDRGLGDPEYNDIVNVQLTHNYEVTEMHWGRLWVGSNATDFWSNLIWKYVNFKNAFPSIDVSDYYTFDLNGLAEELVHRTIEDVIIPEVDPHPAEQGHEVLKQVFLTA